MTREYCEQCPFFIDEKGWMEDDDPYWAENPDSECFCKTCPRKDTCEAEGPVSKDEVLFCIEINRGYLDGKREENHVGAE